MTKPDFFGGRGRERSGFALILVLGLLLLVSALVVGFMGRVLTERSTSAGYKASVSSRILGDLVTGLVQGQINMATTQGYTVAWASQPGMIRTFDNSGNTLDGFKLYSAPNMVVPGNQFAASVQSDCPASATAWTGNTALWTDLNAPAPAADGTYSYPILDTGTASGETQALSASPEGFSIATSAPVSSPAQPAPMPVQWLYVLQDGTIVSPTSAGANSVNVAGDAAATNPIVGRVAFWTDDDTCKVNINTASEGNYWDTPRGNAFSERAMAYWQPAQGEFQRYPGHPAMTCLSSVLYPGTTQAPNFAPVSSYPARSGYMPQDVYENAYQITPRVATGGSDTGTINIYSAVPVPNDVDRLFANKDELIFNPSRLNTYGDLTLTKPMVEQTKFFLTAHSRAPEVNLFNLPRIACWPIYALNNGSYDSTHTTAFDQLIGMCSSIGTNPTGSGGNPYFFQRMNNLSSSEITDISRNTQLYSYLDWLTTQNVPGYGNNFAAKYPTDRDQILTEIFDYIRSTNLADDNVATPFTTPYSGAIGAAVPPNHGLVVPTQYNGTMGFGRFFTLTEFGVGFICNADGNDTTLGSNNPSTNTILQGTALSAGQKKIQAIIVMNFFSPMAGWTSVCPDFSVRITGLDGAKVNGQSLMFPPDATAPYSRDPVSLWNVRDWGGYLGWRYTFFQKRAPAIPASATSAALAADPATAEPDVYPFISAPITITPSGGTMSFGGATVQVSIYAGASATTPTGTPIQTFTITLPAGTFPAPNLVTSGTTDGLTTAANWWSFTCAGSADGAAGRLKYLTSSSLGTANATITTPGAGAFFRSDQNFDVIRTVIPEFSGNFGDHRLVAAKATIPSTVFTTRPQYSNSALFMYSTLPECMNGYNGNCGWDQKGTYVAGQSGKYYAFRSPSIPSGSDVVGPTLTGDFDIGHPQAQDGPYINKPDEGDLGQAGSASGIPYYLTSAQQYLPGKTFFTPNRLMPSPGMFGSLPTGVVSGIPWKTLLFRPQINHPAYVNPATPGGNLPDHLFMDLFWMPVVQPYAISDQFSTAGKINMNYQILPFTYINRSTGMRALLKSERIAAINTSDIETYNGYGPTSASTPLANDPGFAGGGSPLSDFRHLIDPDATLAQFDTKFAAPNFGAFRSPSEICDMYMVPANLGLSASAMDNYWQSKWSATPDNMRERIYTTLYPRLTTKSNTYTIHFRVQTLKKAKGGDPDGTWTESKNVVTGEYRGSTTIERFIDPNNASIPDYAATPTNIPSYQPLEAFYKWRVVESSQFPP